MAAAQSSSTFQHIRGVFCGAGSDMLFEKVVVDTVLNLATNVANCHSPIELVYLGTATYDTEAPKLKQTSAFTERGVNVKALEVANVVPNQGHVDDLLDSADIVLVSGGNTLYAMDRWKMFGVDTAISRAAARGAVLCGGSAGAICWFDAGHSDSMDPASYRTAFLSAQVQSDDADPAATTTDKSAAAAPWSYVRVPCLGLLPGLVCPHYDRVQSNGVLRATDFQEMLKRHSGEHAICIDHHAALVVENGNFDVIRVEGKPGSVNGLPGVIVKKCVTSSGGEEEDAVLVEERAVQSGSLEDIFVAAKNIVPDTRIEDIRAVNPAVFE